jgi:hypothetical protein
MEQLKTRQQMEQLKTRMRYLTYLGKSSSSPKEYLNIELFYLPTIHKTGNSNQRYGILVHQ